MIFRFLFNYTTKKDCFQRNSFQNNKNGVIVLDEFEKADKEVREILKEQAINEGKAPEIAAKMVEGRLQKFYKDICLEEQPFVKDDSVSVGQYVANNGGKIVTMLRYEVGEGMQKREENFAEEVAKQMNQ